MNIEQHQRGDASLETDAVFGCRVRVLDLVRLEVRAEIDPHNVEVIV